MKGSGGVGNSHKCGPTQRVGNARKKLPGTKNGEQGGALTRGAGGNDGKGRPALGERWGGFFLPTGGGGRKKRRGGKWGKAGRGGRGGEQTRKGEKRGGGKQSDAAANRRRLEFCLGAKKRALPQRLGGGWPLKKWIAVKKKTEKKKTGGRVGGPKRGVAGKSAEGVRWGNPPSVYHSGGRGEPGSVGDSAH